MSSRSTPQFSQSTPPLVVLAAWLQKALHRDDQVVSFPGKTSEAVRKARPTGAQYDMLEVQAIVVALEARDAAVCQRLDSLSLTILCSIFIFSQECLAQQRGLCLLARTLHRNERDSAQKASQKEEKKTAMGEAALTLLTKGFVKTDASDKLRRWLGVLALELLERCPQNAEKLRSDPPKFKHWQCLSEVIEHESCQVLKLIAGSMIREMLSLGASSDDFWPSESGFDLYSKFPKTQHHNSQWVTSFEEFIDELLLDKILTQKVSSVLFAHAVFLGEERIDLGEASDILVTISKELNIIVPANNVDPAIYVDVPFSSIIEVFFDRAIVTDSQQPTYGLVIRLMSGVASNYFINATGHADRYVALAFASEKDANTLRRLLIATNVPTNRLLPLSQSDAIDVSQPLLSDDELGAPDPPLSNSQALKNIASLADAISPHGYPVSTINPSTLELVHVSPRDSAEHQEGASSSVVEHGEVSRRVGHNVYMAAEGIDASRNDDLAEQTIEDIDDSQNDDSTSEAARNRGIRARVPNNGSSSTRARHSQASGEGTQEPMEQFNRTSDIEQSSSLRPRSGRNETQGAPERLPQQAGSSEKPVKDKRRPKSQSGEYDDLYDASPKIKDRRRRSPRIIARGDKPQRLERPLDSNTRQASVKTGLATKLSSQLRNANEVVEPSTEETAYDGPATSTKHGTADAKNRANKKEVKAPAPVKARSIVKESTKPTKTTRSKGKAIATKEPPNAFSGDYDLPPSPPRADSNIRTSGNKKKATKAPRNNQKQAKPTPTKAATTTSSQDSAPQLKNALKNKAKGNLSDHESIPNRPRGQKVDDVGDAIWDVDQARSEKEPQTLKPSPRSSEKAMKQETRVAQLHIAEARAKNATKARNQAPMARVVKSKPAPAALAQPRSRRTAAIKANRKIQGLAESDEITDDEEMVPAVRRKTRHASQEAVKAPKTQKVRNAGPDQSKASLKLPATELSTKDSISNSVNVGSSEKQRLDLVSDAKVDISSEKVNVVTNAPTQVVQVVLGDTKDDLHNVNPTRAADTRLLPLHSGHGDHLKQPNPTSVKKGIEASEARISMVPKSGPQLHESITETKPAPTRRKQDNDLMQGHDGIKATGYADIEDQDQVDPLLPCLEDVSLELYSKPGKIGQEVTPAQAPTAPMVVPSRRTSPRLAQAAQKALPKPTVTRRDPFAAKLKVSMPDPKDIDAEVKSREASKEAKVETKVSSTPKTAELSRYMNETKVRVIDELGAATSEETKRAENPRWYPKSAMHLNGDGENPPIQSLKFDGESVSAPRVENKRKSEQVGDTSHEKRVRLTPHERLEGVTARKTSDHPDDKKKTLTLVVSNKPLVIGFSVAGPRNQGTVSTKKSKSPKEVVNGAPDAVQLRKHGILSPTASQAGTGFAPDREAPGIPPRDIQHDLGQEGGAQEKARGTTQRKEAEQLQVPNAVAPDEADTQEHQAQKRKFAPFVDDPAPWEHERTSKRQKTNIDTPPSAHNHHPKMLPDLSPALVHDRSQRYSSQNTRVNENGSPMPFLMTRNGNVAAEEQHLDEDDGNDALAEARLDEQFVLQDDDPILAEPTLPLQPLVSAVSNSQLKTMAYESLSNNSKQAPSSPHAPSAFSTMPLHHIYHDGEIVNADTKELIVPVRPHDPFLGATTHNPQNPFMNALRKATEVAAKRPVSGANGKNASGDVVMRPPLNVGEDPDKTLVEPALKKRYKYVRVSDDSSSSQSESSIQPSQPDESSEEESDSETEAKWRKTLEPHQENMLECLLGLSHRLIRHLIDKETAVKDIVNDFTSHGNRLVESYKTGLQGSIDLHKANNDRRHQNLLAIIEKAQKDRAKTSEKVARGQGQVMKARWEKREETLKGSMAAALAACAE